MGNPGGSDYPLPGANTGELLARLGSGAYQIVGSGKTIVNHTGVRQTIYLKRNDNVPGNGYGSFSVNASVYKPL